MNGLENNVFANREYSLFDGFKTICIVCTRFLMPTSLFAVVLALPHSTACITIYISNMQCFYMYHNSTAYSERFFFVCSSCDVKWYLKPGINMSCSWAENKSSRQWEKTQQQHRVKKNNGSNNDNINDCSVRRRRASPPSNIVCTLLAFNTTNTECVQSVLHGFVKCFTPF